MEAATRETEEEAGAKGKVIHDLGDKFCTAETRSHFFVLEADPSSLLPADEYEDGKTRGRRWVPIQESASLVEKPIPRAALQQAIKVLLS